MSTPQFILDALRRRQNGGVMFPGLTVPPDLPNDPDGDALQDLPQQAGPPPWQEQTENLRDDLQSPPPPPPAIVPDNAGNPQARQVRALTSVPDVNLDESGAHLRNRPIDTGTVDPLKAMSDSRTLAQQNSDLAEPPVLSAHERAVRDLGGEKYERRGAGKVLWDAVKGAGKALLAGESPLLGAGAGAAGIYRQQDRDRDIGKREARYGAQDAAGRQAVADDAKRRSEEANLQAKLDKDANDKAKIDQRERANKAKADFYKGIITMKREQIRNMDEATKQRYYKLLDVRMQELDPNDPNHEAELKSIQDAQNHLSGFDLEAPHLVDKTPAGERTIGDDGKVYWDDKRGGDLQEIGEVNRRARRVGGSGGKDYGEAGKHTTTFDLGGGKTITKTDTTEKNRTYKK